MGFFKRFSRPKATLSLEGNNQLSLGDELKGIVNLNSQEEFDVERIVLSLTCVEAIKKTRVQYKTTSPKPRRSAMSLPEMPDMYGRTRRKRYEETEQWETEEYWDRASLYSDRLQLCRSMHVSNGLDKDFPFVFRLPSIGRETYHSVGQNVTWSINAFMKVRDRESIEDSGEILVAQPTVTAVPTKEVVREVVLIQCAYCSGLMPQTAIFCPNCGARRK